MRPRTAAKIGSNWTQVKVQEAEEEADVAAIDAVNCSASLQGRRGRVAKSGLEK